MVFNQYFKNKYNNRPQDYLNPTAMSIFVQVYNFPKHAHEKKSTQLRTQFKNTINFTFGKSITYFLREKNIIISKKEHFQNI